MGTLSNVKTGRGQVNPPSVRFAPETIPEVESSQTGVSVRYASTLDKFLYGFRVFCPYCFQVKLANNK